MYSGLQEEPAKHAAGLAIAPRQAYRRSGSEIESGRGAPLPMCRFIHVHIIISETTICTVVTDIAEDTTLELVVSNGAFTVSSILQNSL